MKLCTSAVYLGLLCFVWRSNALSKRRSPAATARRKDTALINAAKRGDGDLVSTLIEQGANVDGKNKAKYTALSLASKKGHADVVSILLDHGAKIDITTGDGKTALYEAAENGHVDVVSTLLKYGAGVDHSSIGYTPLMTAAKNGHVDVVSALLDCGAKINHAVPALGLTALMEAAQAGQAEVVSTLLARGADANLVNFLGETAADLANPFPDVRSSFKTNGADVNSQQLLKAAEAGDTELVSTLLDNGEYINSKNSFGDTALELSVKNGHVNVVSTLLDRGAEISYGVLNEAAMNGHADIVEELLAHGADVNGEQFGLYSALAVAAENGHADVVDILLSNGADINNQLKDGETALVLAAIAGHADVVSVLIKHGADISIPPRSGTTALVFAAQGGQTKMVSALLAAGANVEDEDVFSGHTALLLAAWNGNDIEMLSTLLLDHGADINRKTSVTEFSSFNPNPFTPGETALDIVMGRRKCTGKKSDLYQPDPCIAAKDRKAIISFLKEHGAKRSSQL